MIFPLKLKQSGRTFFTVLDSTKQVLLEGTTSPTKLRNLQEIIRLANIGHISDANDKAFIEAQEENS